MTAHTTVLGKLTYAGWQTWPENEQETLEEIGEALSRIDDGVYGLCENCRKEGKPKSRSMIGKTRLKAIPYTRNCIECERKREELSL